VFSVYRNVKCYDSAFQASYAFSNIWRIKLYCVNLLQVGNHEDADNPIDKIMYLNTLVIRIFVCGSVISQSGL